MHAQPHSNGTRELLMRYLSIPHDGDAHKGIDSMYEAHAQHHPHAIIQYLAKKDNVEHVHSKARALLRHVKSNTALAQLDRGTLQRQAAMRTIERIERLRDERPTQAQGLADRFNFTVLQLIEDLYEACILMSTNNAIDAAEYCDLHGPDLAALKEAYRNNPNPTTLRAIRKHKLALESNTIYMRLHDTALDEYFNGLRSIKETNAQLRAL
jgi:hypothetical protein